MRKNFFILMAGLWAFSPGSVFAAGPAAGKIIAENSKTVILEVTGGESFSAGQEIELSYMAGFMEMLIGRFKVAQIHGRRYTLEIVSLNMPPSEGMGVKIVAAEDSQGPLADPLSQRPSGGEGNAAEGEVREVEGEDVLIEMKNGRIPAVGDLAELKYVTAAGMEMDVGTWKVVSAGSGRVRAEVLHAAAAPRRGLKAVFKPGAGNQGTSTVALDSFPGSGPVAGTNVSGAGEIPAYLTTPGGRGQIRNQNPEQEFFSAQPEPALSGAVNRDLFSSGYGETVSGSESVRHEAYRQQMSFDDFLKTQESSAGSTGREAVE